jgi:hypothetical protein
MRHYWGPTFSSEWKVGSPMPWAYGGVTIADPETGEALSDGPEVPLPREAAPQT